MKRFIASISIILIVVLVVGVFCFLTNGFADVSKWFSDENTEPAADAPVIEMPKEEAPDVDLPGIAPDIILLQTVETMSDGVASYQVNLTDTELELNTAYDIKVKYNGEDILLKQFDYGSPKMESYWSDNGTFDNFNVIIKSKKAPTGLNSCVLITSEPGVLEINKKNCLIAKEKNVFQYDVTEISYETIYRVDLFTDNEFNFDIDKKIKVMFNEEVYYLYSTYGYAVNDFCWAYSAGDKVFYITHSENLYFWESNVPGVLSIDLNDCIGDYNETFIFDFDLSGYEQLSVDTSTIDFLNYADIYNNGVFNIKQRMSAEVDIPSLGDVFNNLESYEICVFTDNVYRSSFVKGGVLCINYNGFDLAFTIGFIVHFDKGYSEFDFTFTNYAPYPYCEECNGNWFADFDIYYKLIDEEVSK